MVPDLATSDYRPRIADRLLESKLASAGAVEIRGPKWCGKTEMALQLASSAVMMQDPDEAENNLLLARTSPPKGRPAKAHRRVAGRAAALGRRALRR